MPSLLLATADSDLADTLQFLVDSLPYTEATLDVIPSVDHLIDAQNDSAHDVFLLDARFGTEAVESVLARESDQLIHAPLLILTEGEDPDRAERWIRNGAADCLSISTLDASQLDRVLRHASARHHAQTVRSRAGQQYQALVQNSLDIITVLDENGIIQYESPSVRTLGYEPDELVGESAFEFIHEEDLEAVAERFAEGIEEPGYTTAIEFRFRHQDGSWRFLESRAQNLLDDPIVQGMIVNSRDITERKEMEEALRQSEAHTRALINAMPDAMVRIRRDGTYLDVKLPDEYRAFADADALQGASVYDVLPDAIAEKAMQCVVRALDTGIMQSFEYSIEVNGEERVREARVVVAGDDEVLSVQRDITERKRSEQALRRSREQLRNLTNHLQSVREEERTRISREVHDVLGQKLTSLRMDVAWLERHLGDDTPEEQLEEMKDMIDSTVQTVRRISSELRPGVLDDLGLPAALEWQAQQFESRTDTPCTVETPTTELDLSRDLSTDLFRIFQETLTNVARHAEASTVDARLVQRDGELVLEVRDDGRGIREDEIHNTTSLGLLGMRERVNGWNGSVQFEGQPGEGTTVTVRVPLPSSSEANTTAPS